METRDEVRLPRAAFRALCRQPDADSTGDDPLREAGREAGGAITAVIGEMVSFEEIDVPQFWAVVSAEAAARGLGSFRYERAGTATGQVTVAGSLPPRFTEGMVEGIFSGVASEPVAAVTSSAEDAEATSLLVGHPEWVRILRARLAAGADPETLVGEG